jgi:hypothetical protein
MDVNQLLIALIGATSTLLAALLGSRPKQKAGIAPTKKSSRKRLFRFVLYLLLGGGATYLVMNRLPLLGQIDDRVEPHEAGANIIRRPAAAFTQGRDPIDPPSVPVGSVILSAIPPDKFEMLPSNVGYWSPADGRTVDSTSLYALLTGSTTVPDLRGTSLTKVDTLAADSATIATRSPRSVQRDAGSSLHWYIRIN